MVIQQLKDRWQMRFIYCSRLAYKSRSPNVHLPVLA